MRLVDWINVSALVAAVATGAFYIGTLDSRVERVERRLGTVENGLDEVENRLNFLGETLGSAASKIDEAVRMLASIAETSERTDQQVFVTRVPVVIHTSGQTSPTWAELPKYLAPRVPDPAQEYSLETRCPPRNRPVAAWHEVTGSYPGGTMYTIDPNTDGENVTLTVRAREGRSGYAYVDVLVLCRSVG